MTLPGQSDTAVNVRTTLDEVERILRAYGVAFSTRAEQQAHVGVLDRMGAFAKSERDALREVGLL